MEIQNLLKLRERMKARMPEFLRQDYNKKARLRRRWKRPKGLHSKIRHKVKGKPRPVSQGYRSPRKIRGFHKSGLMFVRVSNTKELDSLDKKVHGIIISSTVGNKKRAEIIKKSLHLGFDILNIKNPQELASRIEQKKAEKKNEKEETVKEIKKEEKPAPAEEKKDEEKKEKEKVLTKRER